jgi:hypothetical protein
MPIPSFQCHKSNSFWGLVKFAFSESPIEGKQGKQFDSALSTMGETEAFISLKKSKAERRAWQRPDRISGARPRLAFSDTNESCTIGKLA